MNRFKSVKLASIFGIIGNIFLLIINDMILLVTNGIIKIIAKTIILLFKLLIAHISP